MVDTSELYYIPPLDLPIGHLLIDLSVASDFIVALNSPQFGGGYPGPNCGRALTISYGGKTTTAVVRDQCPGCGYGDLDMSRGLFNFFAVSHHPSSRSFWK